MTHLHPAQPMRLDRLRLLEDAKRLRVLHHLKVGAAHLVEHPAGVVLPFRQAAEGEDGVVASVLAERAVASRELAEKPQRRRIAGCRQS